MEGYQDVEIVKKIQQKSIQKLMLQKARNRIKLRLQREITYLLQRLLTIPLRMR